MVLSESNYQHTETGIASWYGPGFHGKKTANGEIYNQNALTAAHRDPAYAIVGASDEFGEWSVASLDG